jgi:hypothetical protein
MKPIGAEKQTQKPNRKRREKTIKMKHKKGNKERIKRKKIT